jgi:type II secretory pathway pseudopilin PulG
MRRCGPAGSRPCQRAQALTLIELVVVLAVITILLVLLLPALAKAGSRVSRMRCAHHLKQVGVAVRAYATDHREQWPPAFVPRPRGTPAWEAELVRPFKTLSNEIVVARLLLCPADRRRRAPSFGTLTRSNISYFVSLDSPESRPQGFVAGDRNLTLNGAQVSPGYAVLPASAAVGWSSNLHVGLGNVVLGDGSVQPLTTPLLGAALRNSGPAGVRLLIP